MIPSFESSYITWIPIMPLEKIARGFLKPITNLKFMAPHVFSQHGHGDSFTPRKLKPLAEQQTMAQIPLWPLCLFRDILLIFQEFHCKRKGLQPYPTLELFSIFIPKALL